jgi:hypothetical protein
VSSPGHAKGRRAVLKAIMTAPLAVVARKSEARDYASAAEVLGEIDSLEAELDARLAALSAAVPAATPFARSVRADHDRHRRARAALRKRLRLAPAAEPSPAARVPGTLAQLQALAQELVHAHAEGLPAIGDGAAVDTLARHMVDDARHLAVLQMWAEAEASGD